MGACKEEDVPDDFKETELETVAVNPGIRFSVPLRW